MQLEPAEGQRIFDALGTGGNGIMPFEDQFSGARFGVLSDKFRINWMVNAEKS